MNILSRYLLPPLPEGLEGLTELALDLRWSWNHAADRLWEDIDPELWHLTGNPWLILQAVPTSRFESLAANADFRKLLDTYVTEYREALGAQTWFQQTHSQVLFNVAYFSMEYGLSEALPIYSGGLGILAGDYLKNIISV